jgi:hypothetical protein
MKENMKDMEMLFARFIAGETSNEEERQLYLLFRRDDLPDELARYRQAVGYFENGLTECPQGKKTSGRIRKLWLAWGSVAASFLLLLASSVYFLTAKEHTDPFEGSYIIRNGVRITDLSLIRPELEAAIQKSLLLEQEAERLIERLSEIDDTRERQIMRQMQDHDRQIQDNIRDEYIRNEEDENLKL